MDDAAILARLDGEPDAFAVFYRRHVVRLLDELASRVDDPRVAAAVCAETFALALERARHFDPARGSAEAWLDGIAARLLVRGGAADGAQRRLGMAPLEPGTGSPDRERFVRDLEEELAAAARFRAAHPPRAIPRLSRRAVRGALGGVAAVALLAAVGAFALSRGDAPPGGRAATPPPADAELSPLLAMLPTVDCGGKGVRDEPASPVMPDIGLLQRKRRQVDALAGELLEDIPVETLDRAEPRLARDRRMMTRVHVVPSLAVSLDGRCDSNSGPGVCLVVERGSSFRCFALADVRAGDAKALTPDGLIVGIVPDGIPRVTLAAPGNVMAQVRVVENVYEADYGLLAGTPVRIELPSDTGGCEPAVSTRLLERVAALRRAPREDRRLPQAALDHLRENDRIADVAVRGARFWGADGAVDFWVVPVVPRRATGCAPANRVCVVAVPEAARSAAHCVLHREWNFERWALEPLYAGNAVVFAIVPDHARGARVAVGDQAALVRAKRNVLAGVLPFPYDEFATSRVELTYARDPAKPRVGVVDAAGSQGPYHAEYLLRRLGELGYPTVDEITPGVKAQASTDLYWRRGPTPDLEIGRLARLLEVDRVIRVRRPDRTPLPVLRTDAPIVVVAGRGTPSP